MTDNEYTELRERIESWGNLLDEDEKAEMLNNLDYQYWQEEEQ